MAMMTTLGRVVSAVDRAGCRAFSRTTTFREKIPPWLHEKLTNEGYTNEDIRKHGAEKLNKIAHYIKPDTYFALHKNYDISWKGFKNYAKRKKEEEFVKDQEYLQDRTLALGAELAAATFLVHRGAAVKFHGKDRWVVRDPETEEYDLPGNFTRGYVVEAIDMRDFHIIHNGFQNIAYCEEVRSIALKNQPRVDDWCIDFITAIFHKTLEYIDISGCPKVTERGISVLHRCKKLRCIYMRDMPNVKHGELLAIHLEDAIPGVVIDGSDYWSAAQPEN